ncbi:aspartyl protease family protein [Roseomonas sp. KE2513]|uniref:aspartyl protease family protein n=1 Tax=Roseomonas sp. KE2513 TaxID=2479202 RepID=UPI00281690C8|nr:aspartyl protease family protein [Roseomonas sp. KE2513]
MFDESATAPLQGSSSLNVADEINGKPVVLEVSTGLGLTSLLPDVAKRLGLPEDPRRQSSYPSPGGPVTQRNVLSRSILALDHEWSGRSLAVRPFFGHAGGRPGFDGVLGADLLREAELEIDLPAHRIAFHRPLNCRPGAPPWAPAASAPVELRGLGVPVITVRVNGQPVSARIQSGDNATSMTEALASRLALGNATGRRTRSFGSDPAGRAGREYRLDEIAVGDEVLRDQLVVVTPGLGGSEEQMILGQDWLQRRKVWLSFINRWLFLGPVSK